MTATGNIYSVDNFVLELCSEDLSLSIVNTKLLLNYGGEYECTSKCISAMVICTYFSKGNKWLHKFRGIFSSLKCQPRLLWFGGEGEETAYPISDHKLSN